MSVLNVTAQPPTLVTLQAQLRRRGKRIGNVHGRLELLALRGRLSKTRLLAEIAWVSRPSPGPFGPLPPAGPPVAA